VSLLSPDRLSIALYPDRLSWLRVSGWKPRVVEKGELQFMQSQAGILQAMDQLLGNIPRNMKISVVLSNRLLRYACIPNPDAARNAAERLMLARHAFVSIHGQSAEQWELILSHGAIGKEALACAVDADLLAELKSAIQRHRHHLHSMKPYLMAAFNVQNRKSRSKNGLFTLAEPGRLCAVAWREGGWKGVQQAHFDGDTVQTQGLLDRMRVLADLPDEKVQVCAPEMPNLRIGGDESRHQFSWLPGLSVAQDYAWGGAMLGVGR